VEFQHKYPLPEEDKQAHPPSPFLKATLFSMETENQKDTNLRRSAPDQQWNILPVFSHKATLGGSFKD